jgi:hypothetical protein
MTALLIKVAVILSVLFGSTGGAVALVTNSLPDSALYSAKLAMEQARLDATPDPAVQAAVNMALVQERVQEMQRLALAGEAPDEATMLRLQTHLEQALRLAAGLSDDDLQGALNQAREMLQDQEREMLQTQTRVDEPLQERLREATRLLTQAREQVEAGLQDAQAFRWQYGYGPQPEEPAGPAEPAGPGGPGGNPDCPNGTCEPEGDQHQYGPGPEANPDCPNGTCEPEGDQYLYQHQYQYGPQPEEPGGPGEPAGPGGPGGNPDCPNGTCEPEGDQHQYGPGPEANPDCPNGTCEPEGEQQQYGPGPAANPDCPNGNCEPVGEQYQQQHQVGPQPPEAGPDEPGGPGEPEGPCENCDPEGEQQQQQEQHCMGGATCSGGSGCKKP